MGTVAPYVTHIDIRNVGFERDTVVTVIYAQIVQSHV